MTTTTAYVGEEAAHQNLATLDAATDGLTLEQRDTLRSHLLGGLACYVDAETFARVAESAREWATR